MANNNIKLIDKYLSGETSKEESLEALTAIASDPKLEAYVIAQRRYSYEEQQMEEYGSFIPARNMAADDGHNLCDFQCELYILRKAGIFIPEAELVEKSRMNYWLRNQGTPLFNVGRLLGSKDLADMSNTNGFLVNRVYQATWENLVTSLDDHYVIAIVNGDVLEPKADGKSDIISLKDDANHAVVVLSVSPEKVRLYNPANNRDETEYDAQLFRDAWSESMNYMVTVRAKEYKEEYFPQPIDVEMIPLDDDFIELTEMIAENAHDVWAENRMKQGWTYGPRDDAKKQNPDLVPYDQLPEGEKLYDREMAINTIKLVKRLGYRLINITDMYRCPECGEIIEPNYNFCPSCGRQLNWEDFR